MEQQKPIVRNRLTRQITSFSVGKEELQKLFQILQERSNAASEIEIEHYRKFVQPNNVHHDQIEKLKEGFELRLTVNGVDGQELWGSIDDIFNSPNFPDLIKSIYVNSSIPLRSSYNYIPLNSFVLFFDFSKPDLFNLSFLPSQATPNESNIEVNGYDATWVHGVFNEFSNFIKKYPSQFTWVHKHSVYDLLVWGLGIPFGFWLTYKCSAFLNRIFGEFSTFVQSASYLYVFLASLMIFRLLFHYARWIWPPVEYRSQKNKALKHRIILGVIALSILSAFIYDLIKAIF